MNEKVWRILFVDDDESKRNEAVETFNLLKDKIIKSSSSELQVVTRSKPLEALDELKKDLFDLLILDVKQDQTAEDVENYQAGRIAFEEIKASRFIPVIFYTGLPDEVCDLESPTVRIVEKTRGLVEVVEEAIKIFESGIPAINRGMFNLLEDMKKNYFWTFIEEYGKYHGGCLPDISTLSYLSARRLANFMTGAEGIKKLVENIERWGDTLNINEPESKVNPLRYYIIPSLAKTPRTGDIYTRLDKQNCYWVVLSPTCDLVNKKISKVLLAACHLLEDQPEFKAYREAVISGKGVSRKQKSLEALLANNRSREHGARDAFFFLPSALTLPNLIVDFRELATCTAEDLDPENTRAFQRVFSLDSPFAESLLSRYIQFSGRVGMPDLYFEGILKKMQTEFSVGAGEFSNLEEKFPAPEHSKSLTDKDDSLFNESIIDERLESIKKDIDSKVEEQLSNSPKALRDIGLDEDK